MAITFRYKGKEYTIPKEQLKRPDLKRFMTNVTFVDDVTRKKVQFKTIRPPSRAKHTIEIPIKTRRPVVHRDRKRMTGLEIQNLKNLGSKYGMENDTFDYEAEIDRSLTYAENKRILKRKLRRRGGEIPLEELREDRYKFRMASYLDDLQFKAEAGDRLARKELRLLVRGYE